MKKIFLIIVCFFLILPFLNFSQSLTSDRILGEWMSPKKDLLVECYKEKELYYSKVIWFKSYHSLTPDDPNSVPENQWINSIVMDKFYYAKDQWKNGKIWNLKNGKRYKVYIQLLGNDTLKVTGYVFLKMFNGSTYFVRYNGERLRGND